MQAKATERAVERTAITKKNIIRCCWPTGNWHAKKNKQRGDTASKAHRQRASRMFIERKEQERLGDFAKLSDEQPSNKHPPVPPAPRRPERFTAAASRRTAARDQT